LATCSQPVCPAAITVSSTGEVGGKVFERVCTNCGEAGLSENGAAFAESSYRLPESAPRASVFAP
jgi:hypothetical protein